MGIMIALVLVASMYAFARQHILEEFKSGLYGVRPLDSLDAKYDSNFTYKHEATTGIGVARSKSVVYPSPSSSLASTFTSQRIFPEALPGIPYEKDAIPMTHVALEELPKEHWSRASPVYRNTFP
jgi:hypothetical protein